MNIVEIMVSVAEFGEALGAMRSWLDKNKSGPVKFETASEPTGIRVRLEFDQRGLAEGFLQRFGETPQPQAA